MSRGSYEFMKPPFFHIHINGPGEHDPIWDKRGGFPDWKKMRRFILGNFDIDRALEMVCADDLVSARAAMAAVPNNADKDMYVRRIRKPCWRDRLCGRTQPFLIEYGLPMKPPNRNYGCIHYNPPWAFETVYFSEEQLVRAMAKAEAAPMGLEFNRVDIMDRFTERYGKCWVCGSDQTPLGLWPAFPWDTFPVDSPDYGDPVPAAPAMCPECAHFYMAAYFELCKSGKGDEIVSNFWEAVHSDDPELAPDYFPYMKAEVLKRRGLL